jgi:hypothetical protein
MKKLLFQFIFIIVTISTIQSKDVAYTLTNNNKNVILCDLNEKNAAATNKCFEKSFNFSFSAFFHNKELTKLKSLKNLAQTLSQSSKCEISHMKYDSINQRFDYFNPGDLYYWHEGKKLNFTFNPEVFIVRDETKNDRKIIIFRCSMPTSDAELSKFGNKIGYRSIQSHPVSTGMTTVSGVYVRLKFEKIENIDINVKKQPVIRDDLNWNEKIIRDRLLNQKTSERFFIYYDGKCKSCYQVNDNNNNDSSINYKRLLFDPFSFKSFKCDIKPGTCESNGKCFNHKEIYTPLEYKLEEEKPFMNMFVCNSSYSQSILYQPCSIRNGNCSYDKKCNFNARTFEVTCD